jgi:SAM-dependent methyltransferase
MEIRLTRQCHEWLAGRVREGDRCIDATCGNGHDTACLARLAGEAGRVLAVDLQEAAIRKARRLLEAEGLSGRVQWAPGGHERLRELLPPETTVASLRQAVDLLAPEGAVSVIAYRGHPGGMEEYGAVAAWAAGLPKPRWKVVVVEAGAENGPVWLRVLPLQAGEPAAMGLDCCPESGAEDLA